MPYLIVGMLLVIVLMFAGRAMAGADMRKVAYFLRKFFGAGVLAASVALGVTGRLGAALPLALLGIAILGRGNPFSSFGSGWTVKKTAGQSTSVRTDTLEMELDHDSGKVDGTIIRGRFAGLKISALNRGDLMELWRDCVASDTHSAQLLEAYLDRFDPTWREEAGSNGEHGARSGEGMSVQEAYDVLGLTPDAGREEIQAAHRELMKRHHPDHGGSSYIAAKINEAKELLLGR